MDYNEIVYNALFIAFLGLFLAFNPMLILVDLFLVLKSSHPIKNTLVLTAGFATAITILFTVASFIIDPDSQISLSQLETTFDLPPWIDIFGGLLLIYWAIKIKSKTIRPKTINIESLKIPDRVLAIYSFGFIKALLSITNLFAVFILAKQYAVNEWTASIGAVALVWLLIIGLIPILMIIYLHYFKHQSLLNFDKRVNTLLAHDTQQLITNAFGLIGFFFVVKGIFEFIR